MVTPHAAQPKIYDPSKHPELVGEERRPPAWLVPLLGVIFVALLAVGFALGSSSPNSDASGLSVISYFSAHTGQIRASGLLSALAVPAGVFFFYSLRERACQSRAARPFGNVALLGMVLFAATGCLSAGLSFALSDVPRSLTPGAAQALNILTADATTGFLIGGLSTMMLAFGMAFLVGKAFPVWLGWLSIVIGIVSLAGPLAFFGLLATGVWVLIVSAMLYMRRDSALTGSAPAI